MILCLQKVNLCNLTQGLKWPFLGWADKCKYSGSEFLQIVEFLQT